MLSGKVKHHYKVECIRDGKVIWTEEIDNLLTTAGANKYLDATIKTGLASPVWYIGLKGTGTAQAADTMASHATWSEIHTQYSDTYRVTFNTSAAISGGSISNAGNVAVFHISGSTTIYGVFLVDEHTKNGTDGTLLGVADFSGSQAVNSGDTLNVTLTCSLS